MINILGYEILEKIYESSVSQIYRAIRTDDKNPVVLKLLAKSHPTPHEIAQYKNEYTIGRALRGLPGVIQVCELENYQNGFVLIAEDIGGESLRSLMESGTFRLEESLTVAIQICATLGEIHGAQIIHKDINPSNIIINPRSGKLQIIDLGISTDLLHEDTAPDSPSALTGTLAYMSPEQTGRMNCQVDYRTDYYSLGVTLFELFTRTLPFEANDPLGLIHCHIAAKPKTPKEIVPDLPEPVSDVILKLLSKNPEARYQSASGIKADFERCLQDIREFRTVYTFELASSDVSARFEIPHKLYGRDRETENLLAAYSRVARGGKEIMLVTGEPGIGKTSLVQEMYRPITGQRGYFVSAKFDQLSRGISHSAVLVACRKIVSQILTESQDSVLDCKHRLLSALGNSARIITEVIPEVEFIVGPQPTVPELRPVEAQARFRVMFQAFVRALCSREYPIVIFLDDIQWADTSSAKLMELVMADSDTRYFFLVAAYRDKEVESSHPVLTTLETLQKANTPINRIHLGPLKLEQIVKLASDTFHCALEASETLAELVREKTTGNPFFIKEFLQTLHQEKQIQFDFLLGAWQWDLGRIQQHQIPDNVVDLMEKKILKLPSHDQELIKIAACIGSEFGVHLLSWAANGSARNAVVALKTAVSEGLISPIGDRYKLLELDVPVHDQDMTIRYRFAHDRIQYAAYSLVPELERPAIHQHIGRVLLQRTPEDRLGETIFEIVNQMNLAVSLISDDQERHELAEMNLEAGRKAAASGAYEVAFTYFESGIEALGCNSWQQDYELTLALYTQAAEAAFVTTRFDDVKRLASHVVQNAQKLEQKVSVYEMEIRVLIALNNRAGAIKIALPLLAEFGQKFPDEPNKAQVFADFVKTRLTLSTRRIEAIEHLPPMTDPKMQGAMRIMETVVSAAYSVAPNLFLLMLFRMLRLSVKHGSTRQSAFVYAGYGIILCSLIGDIDSGRRFGELALKLIQRPDLKSQQTRVTFAVNALIFLWCRSLRDGLKPLEENFSAGLELGDIEYAALSIAFFCTHSFGAGEDLTELSKKMARYSDALGKLKQKFPGYLIQIYHQELLNMMGLSENPCRLVGDAYDADKILPELVESNDRAIALATFVQKLRLNYLFYNYQDAVENGLRAEEFLDGGRATVLVPVVSFYIALARLELLTQSDGKRRRALLKKVMDDRKKLKKWSQTAPANYLHKFHLVEAERLRVLGRDDEAADHYGRAIALSRSSGYINEEALAYEKAAMFHLSRGDVKNAGFRIEQARHCYSRWGARAKVKHIEDSYSQLLRKPLETMIPGSDSASWHGSAPPISDDSLDLAAVLKASQTLSSEIVFEELVRKLMMLVIEVAGAEKGVLLLERDGSLVTEASLNAKAGAECEFGSVSVEEAPEVLAAVVLYVARTKEPVLLNDAGSEGAFIQDKYVLEQGLKSVCCLPIMSGSRFYGVLYLENNQTVGAFTIGRVEMLKVLSAQAAISIENARLYKTLDETAERYKSLFENALEAIFVIQDGNFKFLNPSTVTLTGYSSEELYSRPVLSFVYPEDRAMVKEQGRKRLADETSSGIYSFRILRKDSTALWVQINSVAIRWGDRPAILAFLTDITELKRAADLHARTERLNAIADLAGGVAHNFNNMLQVVMAGVEVALGNLESGNTSQMRKNLERIRDSSRLGSDTVKRLQSFAKIRVEEKLSEPHTFDVSQVVRQAAEITHPWWKTNLEKEGIHVEMNQHLTDGCFVSGKDSELFEVVVNLIKNAAEAMPGGGHIRIATSVIDDEVVLEVQDTGVGIPEQHLGRLFEPFWTTKGQKGTGLGLSVSQGILKSHGGTLSVVSRVGVGTTFTIKLPLAQAPTEMVSQARATIHDLNLTILVIDDTQSLVTLFHDLLTAHGQTVLTAVSGSQGIDLYKQHGVDLVLCDLGMPGMSGWEVGRMVRSLCQEKGIPKTTFLLLTGWGGQSLDRERIKESGIDGVLEKPVDMKKLFEMIRQVAADKRPL